MPTGVSSRHLAEFLSDSGSSVFVPPEVLVNPTVLTELSLSDPGEEAVWIDISAYVLSPGIQISVGRSSELDRFQAGTMTVQLNNRDGRFDPTYSGSPHYPNLRPLNMLRQSAVWDGTPYTAFTGYVDGWTPEYPDGTLDHSVVNLHANDTFSILARQNVQVTGLDTSVNDTTNRISNPSVEENLDGYTAFLGAISRTGLAGNNSAYGIQLITTNANDSHVHWDDSELLGLAPGETYTFSLAAARSFVGPCLMDLTIQFYSGVTFVNSIFKTVTVGAIGPAPGGRSGFERYFVSGTAGAGVDRAQVKLGTHGAQGVMIIYTDNWRFEQGAGQLDNLAELPEERSDVRINRILNAIGWPATQRDLAIGASRMIRQTDLPSTEVLGYLQLIEQSENGRLWVDPDGDVKFLGRWAMGQSPYTVPRAIFGQSDGQLPYVRVTPSYDETFIHNEIRLTGAGADAVEQVAADSTSIGHYQRRVLSQSGLLVTDNELNDAASYELERYKDVHLRFLTLDLAGMLDPSNLWPVILSLKLSDRITVRFSPPGRTGEIVQDCFIEGIRHSWQRPGVLTTTLALSSYGIGYEIYPSGKGFFVLGSSALTTGDGVLVY